jgi:hypothetical protein
LNSYHLWINLYNSAYQPIPYPIPVGIFMIAIHIDSIANLILLFAIWSAGEENIGQFASLLDFNEP